MIRLLKNLFSRLIIIPLLLLLQVVLFALLIWEFSNNWLFGYLIFFLMSMAAVLWVINKGDNPSYKIAWIIPIMMFPLFGGLFYIVFGNHSVSQRYMKRNGPMLKLFRSQLTQDEGLWQKILASDPHIAKQSAYILNSGGYPVFENTATEYFASGEAFFEDFIQQLEQAKHYIFLEFFIIHDGVMWGRTLDILKRKAAEGLDIRLMYDDVGCVNTLPFNYYKKMEALGIKCVAFNPLVPLLSLRMNNRDHRKIMIIDGHTAYTGGINMADEYINAIERFGHWKDAALRLKGDAVWNMTIMFLEAWNILRSTDTHYDHFRPHVHHDADFVTDGMVQPYADSPLDREMVSEMVYINMIGNSQHYLYITTPYLIIDNELVVTLALAAKSGVDIRIITPHIPDKWYVHIVSRAYYMPLLKAGVRIYEYTPGFIHAKSFVCDDEIAVVGTANMDFRSLYLHFECGVWMYRSKAVGQLKADYLKTLEQCEEVTSDYSFNRHWYQRLAASVLMLFAPLM
ncbi:MAG: cardiolipin synthase [Syntrophomonadaceae bacterium]|nr:cardiolipin synthase [Syntrophomonadaceae bacterium]